MNAYANMIPIKSSKVAPGGPGSKLIPEFKGMKVAVEKGSEV